MALYTKTDWVSGETPLSATNLNKIENGVAELENKLNSILAITSQSLENTTISAKSGHIFSGNLKKDGYTPIGILGFNTTSPPLHIAHCEMSPNGDYRLYALNPYSYETTTTNMWFRILWMSNEAYQN